MKYVIAALLCLISSLSFAAGNATLRVIPYVLAQPNCPMGFSFSDGCANAPAPESAAWLQSNAFQPGGFFNTTAATTANYMATNCGPGANVLCRPPWNVGGVDYAIGNYTPCRAGFSASDCEANPTLATCALSVWNGTCLLDPNITLPTGCTYNTTFSGTGGGEIQCNPVTWNGQLQHFNLGPVNGHGCTSLRVNSGTPGVSTALINDIFWFNDTGLCNITISSGTEMLLVLPTYSGGLTISNFLFDGNSSVWDNKFGGTSGSCDGSTTVCNPQQSIDSQQNLTTIQYGVMKDFAATPYNPQQNASASGNTFQYDWIQTWCVRVSNCHAEWFNGGGGTAGALIDEFSYTVQTNEGTMVGGSQAGPNPIFWSNSNVSPIGTLDFDHMTIVNSYTGGMTALTSTFSGCLGNPPTSLTGGNPTTPVCPSSPNGNIFYVTAATVPLTHGLSLPAAGGGGTCFGFGTYKEIPGPYPTNVIDEWSIDQDNGALYPNYNTAGTCTNASAFSHMANIALTSGGAYTIGTTTFDHNYMDVSSQGGGTAPVVTDIGNGSNPPQVSFTGSATGTSLTSTTSITLTAGQTIQGSGLGNCASGVGSCPTIAANHTGTVFTLNSSVAATGTISMTGLYPTTCTTTPTFTNNRDMTATVPDSWLNQWSVVGSTQPVVGC